MKNAAFAEQDKENKEGALIDLGLMSYETKGSAWGAYDGGGGFCFC